MPRDVRIWYRSGYKYQLERGTCQATGILGYSARTQWLLLSVDGDLFISAGYAWDGASGPTIDDETNMRPSLVHDALYQLIRLGFLPRRLRKRVDVLFWRQLLEDGMNPDRAKLYYLAVRQFGGPSASARSEREIHVAPANLLAPAFST